MPNKSTKKKQPLILRAKIIYTVFFAALAIGAVALLLTVVSGTKEQRTLKRHGQPTTAVITNKYSDFVPRAGSTNHLAYSFSLNTAMGPQTYTHEIIVGDNAYTEHKIGDKIDVLYQKDNPNNSLPDFELGQVPAIYVQFIDLLAVYFVLTGMLKLDKRYGLYATYFRGKALLSFGYWVVALVAAILIGVLLVAQVIVPALNYLLY